MKLKLVIDQLPGHEQKGVIGKIYKSKGDKINAGDILFTIEAGKGSIKYKSKYNGVITSLDIDEGDTVTKNQVIGSVDGEEVSNCNNIKNNAPKKTSYSFGISTPF
ncbi:lipoyl domain-containing protein [Defluviitalea phaphyphila]|uniref:lipoyl domain-containing protein n=1 Tax=Defluviitalea phaphyphila TaxID=1473580 RepID=UPI0007315A02|nr:lipoyl domain-containing protein [Defluviitalea phaphyphila]